MLGPFLANLYIGLYDKNLPTYSMLHYYLNWVIAVIELIAAMVLITKPRSIVLVSLSGIVWPLVYFASLAIDVETLLCLGTGLNCWPSTTAAFQYLILGDSKQGWGLWSYTMEISIALLVVVIPLSIISVKKLRDLARIAKLKETNPPLSK